MSSHISKIRIVLASAGFISALFLPPWVPVAVVILLALRYRSWEAIVLGAWMDLLWLPLGFTWHTMPFFTLAAIIIVWGFEPLRVEFLH